MPIPRSFRIMAAVLIFMGMAVGVYGQDAVIDTGKFSRRLLDPIEGLWQFPGDGAMIEISRKSVDAFDIVLLDSPNLDAETGVIGQAVSTPAAGHYDCRMRSGKLGEKRIKNATVELVITENGSLQFKPYREGMGVSLKRWFYRTFKLSITDGNSPLGLTGAKKLYPLDSSSYKPCL